MKNKIKYILLKLISKLLSTKRLASFLEVSVGKNPNFGKNINFGSEPYLITIGDNFNSASNINFITHDGSIRVLRNLDTKYNKSDLIKPINIGNNVFIGMNVNILPGTTIGNNVIIGTNSVVRGNLKSDSVYAGIPVKYLCSIKEYEEKNKNDFLETKHFNYFEKKKVLLNKNIDKNKKKKLFLFIHKLNAGGSQKIVMNLSKYLNKDKFDISLVVIDKTGEHSSFTHKGVKIIDLKSKNIRSSIFKIYSLIKKEKPDIVFSALSYLSLLFSIFMPFIKSKNMIFVARETNTLSISNQTLSFTKIRNILYKLFYKRFDKIICQSQYMKNDLIENYNINEEKMEVIYNPVDISFIQSKLLEDDRQDIFPLNKTNLLSVGRLHKNKGFDLLINSFSELPEHFTLTILGEGKEKDNLIKLANELNCSNRIYFNGFESNPYKYMAQADLLVLSSRHEGLPNVVLEANVCRLPVVAFGCPGGTKEIIEDSLNGFIVQCKNINDLVENINKASIYNWDKDKIFENVDRHFNANYIINKYENYLLNETNEK